MWVPKSAALIRGQCLFEARCLLEEIWYLSLVSLTPHQMGT